MADPFPPLGWSLRPESWPYWMPKMLIGMLPPLAASPAPASSSPHDPWNQISAPRLPESLGAESGTAFPQPSELSSAPSWLRTAMVPGGGILGAFPQPNDASAASSSGLLAPLMRRSDLAEQDNPARQPSAPPFSANLGSLPASASPIEHLASSHLWPLAPPAASASAAPFPGGSLYLSQVPPAPDWESIPTAATSSTAQLVDQPPALSPRGAAVPGSSPADSSPLEEAALADEARRMAALRLGRRERPSALARSASPAPELDADADDPGLSERARLNFLNSYYRGTLVGASRLAGLAHLAATADAAGISPDLKRVRDDLRREYQEITADLARYDRMRSFGSASE